MTERASARSRRWILAAAVFVAVAARGASAQSIAQSLLPSPSIPTVANAQSVAPSPAVDTATNAAPSTRAIAVHRDDATPRDSAALRKSAAAPQSMGKPVALMVVGAAALVSGAIIGGDVGTIFMVGGAVMGLYGLYQYIQ